MNNDKLEKANNISKEIDRLKSIESFITNSIINTKNK